VIIEGEDIYGDGVNIAARLEPLAEPGGICISSIVNESIGNRIEARFQDGGSLSLFAPCRPPVPTPALIGYSFITEPPAKKPAAVSKTTRKLFHRFNVDDLGSTIAKSTT
jgi:hypothetical protein